VPIYELCHTFDVSDKMSGEEGVDRSISVGRAYLLMLWFLVPLLLGLVGIAWALRGAGFLLDAMIVLQRPGGLLVFLILGVVLHEGIHGLSWAWLGGKSLSSVRLGFQWKSLTPYAHMREPISVRAYRWGAVMPALLLGFLPYTLGLLLGSPFLFLYGWFFILAAGGDFVILWLLRNDRGDLLVKDHPERVGCVVVNLD
jgi:hypothetical protein